MFLFKINLFVYLCVVFCNDLYVIKLVFGKEKEFLELQYQVGLLLGSGGFGLVYLGICVFDNLLVVIKYVEKDWIFDWGELFNGI